jgi:tetraacyldisaccharide 4'-kinase
MALRARLQSWLVKAWQRRGLTARLLFPLAVLHGVWRRFDIWRYRVGLARAQRLPVPVVVIGNLYVGGSGKTPLTIEVTRALRARGWSPGVISRGYGAERAAPRPVQVNGSASDYGDEPLLIARAGQVPVAVGADRAAAARLLLNLHPNVDVIVADDGLQHRRLARDVEIAVVHEPGFGNGWLLPAGPLRDPPWRLDGVDAVVLHGLTPPVRIYSPFFRMKSSISCAYPLKDPARRIALSDLAAEQRTGNHTYVAAAGIGQPERFFAMLRAFGLEITALALSDHYDFARNPFIDLRFERAFITEKDAVKCAANPLLANDARLYVVPLEAQVDTALIDLIEARMRPVQELRNHGPSPARDPRLSDHQGAAGL